MKRAATALLVTAACAAPAPPHAGPRRAAPHLALLAHEVSEAAVRSRPPVPPPPPVVRARRTPPPPAPGGRGAHLALVSWYGDESGSRTASGEHFDPGSLTFAHRSMRFGTSVRFCHSGRCVVARCTDRGPFVGGRTFDLSRGAFAAIASLGSGVVSVSWAVV